MLHLFGGFGQGLVQRAGGGHLGADLEQGRPDGKPRAGKDDDLVGQIGQIHRHQQMALLHPVLYVRKGRPGQRRPQGRAHHQHQGVAPHGGKEQRAHKQADQRVAHRLGPDHPQVEFLVFGGVQLGQLAAQGAVQVGGVLVAAQLHGHEAHREKVPQAEGLLIQRRHEGGVFGFAFQVEQGEHHHHHQKGDVDQAFHTASLLKW